MIEKCSSLCDFAAPFLAHSLFLSFPGGANATRHNALCRQRERICKEKAKDPRKGSEGRLSQSGSCGEKKKLFAEEKTLEMKQNPIFVNW